MDSLDDSAAYICPHCGERIDTPIDGAAGEEQVYTDDCPVCCNPLRIRVTIDARGGASATAEAENA